MQWRVNNIPKWKSCQKPRQTLAVSLWIVLGSVRFGVRLYCDAQYKLRSLVAWRRSLIVRAGTEGWGYLWACLCGRATVQMMMMIWRSWWCCWRSTMDGGFHLVAPVSSTFIFINIKCFVLIFIRCKLSAIYAHQDAPFTFLNDSQRRRRRRVSFIKSKANRNALAQ